jgi:mRNA-degrading endonuclease RelE of RelBE toxin-antitoxin system
MKYNIEFKPRAVKDIATFPSRIQARILARIEEMSNTLSGDVKRLYEDLRCLREAKEAEKTAPTIGIDELKKQIGGQTSRCRRRGKTRG